MNIRDLLRHRLTHLLFSFLVAGAAAAVFQALRAPLPWMLGSLLATALLRINGAPILIDRRLPLIGQWIIGASLGLYFTPDTLRLLSGYTPYAIASCLLATALGLLATWGLIRFAKADFDTAFLLAQSAVLVKWYSSHRQAAHAMTG